MPASDSAEGFFVELHGLLLGGEAGRRLVGVSVSDLRSSLACGSAAFLFLRRPSMELFSMTANIETVKK